jgi:hypothetical protein
MALLVIWIVGWWTVLSGPLRLGPVDVGFTTAVLLSVLTTARSRAGVFVVWPLLALSAVAARAVMPLSAIIASPIGTIAPEAVWTGVLAGMAVRDPVAAAAAAVGASAVAGFAHGADVHPLGSGAWYFASLAGAVAFVVAAGASRWIGRGRMARAPQSW